jgi:hypothetical protein
MLKRTHIKMFAVCLVVACTLTAVFVGRAFLKTKNSCQTFQIFCDHLRQKEWTAAQAMIATDIEPRRFRVETGAVYYWDHDITAEFSGAQPLFKETFKYYLLDRSHGDKTAFGLNSSSQESGCVDLENNKITYIKIY